MKAAIEEQLEDHMMVMEGYDNCIIGIGRRCGQLNVLVYSYEKVIKQLIKEGLSEEDAVDHFDFNILGAYVGAGTPMFIHQPK
jgi:hypothetical protein